MWKYDDVNSVTIELSSLCNAACPWCPRYEDFSEVVNNQLEPQYITIDQFKEWFPPENFNFIVLKKNLNTSIQKIKLRIKK